MYAVESSEAGIQVPLLSHPGASRPACPDFRVRPLRLQQGACGTVSGMDPGAAPRHVRGHLQNAHRMEAGRGNSLACRTLQGSTAGSATPPASRLRQVLAQAKRIPEVQEEGQNPGLRHLLRELFYVPRREGQAGKAE